jgi:hypothetical protein
VLGEHATTERIDLAKRHGLHAGTLKTEAEAAYAAE